jgi:DNA-binding transcriptional ArsR family regulator
MTVNWELVARRSIYAVRVEILELVASRGDREISPKEISRQKELGLSLTSYHVKQLREQGLLECVRTEPRRRAVEHYYRLAAPARAAA